MADSLVACCCVVCGVIQLMDILGGMSRDQVVQAYLLAGKDENAAINMLLG